MPDRRSGRYLLWLSIIFDFLLFIATSVYACFAYYQWRAMKNQADVMVQQLEVTKRSIAQTQEMLTYASQQANAVSTQANIAKESERPSVLVKEVSFSNVASNRTPSYVVQFENSGKTTARAVSLWAIILNSATQLTDKPEYPEPDGTPSVLDMGAGGTAMVAGNAKSALKPSDISAIKEKRAWLYVYGFARYKDQTGQEHEMKYCVYYDPADGASAFCSQHNSSN
jgi:hypothetical protein